MTLRSMTLAGFLVMMIVLPIAGQTNQGGAVGVPAGTKVGTIRFSDEGQTEAHLKPAEQVALLFTYAIWQAERSCSDNRNGIGRLCSLKELVAGVDLKNGSSAGLSVDPTGDTNYRYSVTNIGNHCVVTALPSAAGLGAFAIVGTGGTFSSADYYLNPEGGDLAGARKLSEVGYSGRGFQR